MKHVKIRHLYESAELEQMLINQLISSWRMKLIAGKCRIEIIESLQVAYEEGKLYMHNLRIVGGKKWGCHSKRQGPELKCRFQSFGLDPQL
jgi:hypothetical protein